MGIRIAGLTCCLLLGAIGVQAQEGDYRHYNGDAGGMHYSPLTQINASNVGQLQQSWRRDLAGPEELENTPIVVDGVLYGVGGGKVFALDGATGAEKWAVTAVELGGRGNFETRGAAWWSDGKQSRLLVPARNFVFSIDPATGKADPDFGDKGRIDLQDNLRGPASDNYVRMRCAASVWKDIFFTCGEVGEQTPASPGDIRAWDVRTGKLVWAFHVIPHPGEPNYESWPADAWQKGGGANAWPGLAVDEKRGIVFAATGSGSDDFYGGERPGKNLYANSLLALDARTGKLLWHFQAVHHDLWDYDFAAPPILVTVKRNGRTIDAVAATNKTGFVYVFDRVTGKPLFPIDEKPVPTNAAPGDVAWPTQPHPRLPPPLAHQSITADQLTQRTPEMNAWAREKFATFANGPIFTPPQYQKETVAVPGFSGGVEWGGMTFDPKNQLLFANSENIIWTTAVIDRKSANGPTPHSRYTFSGYNRFMDPDNYPASAAPWGYLTAINLNTGRFAWRIPFGEYPELAAQGIKDTGTESYGASVATASGILLIAATNYDHKMRAFESRTGKLLWETVLPYAGNASPLTYMAGGRQYVVIATSSTRDRKGANAPKGAAFVAYALPQ